MKMLLMVAGFVLAAGQSPPPDRPPAPKPVVAPPVAPKVDPKATDAARAAITLPDGSPVPLAWPMGRPLVLSARTSSSGSLPKSFLWAVDDAWVDAASVRSDDGVSLTLATGRNPRQVAISLDVAKGDTVDRTTIPLSLYVDADEPATVAEATKTAFDPDPRPPGYAGRPPSWWVPPPDNRSWYGKPKPR